MDSGASLPHTLEGRESALRAALARADQSHLLAFYGELDARSRARLLGEIERIDLELVRSLGRTLAKGTVPAAAHEFAPADVFPLERDARQNAEARQAVEAGEELLRSGAVAYLLVAGGQASRLGFDGPKGCYPVGPVSGMSLFEWFSRKLLAARARYGARTAWYVMTSESNDEATRSFFEQHRYFGLERRDVFFFSQAMLPALDPRGRILMSAKDRVFLAPNGHGGVLAALASSGALEDARSRGARVFSYFQVDNPMAPPADPLFLGLHARARAEMSTKVVKKRAPGEKVGVLGRVDGKLTCIEYSDLPAALRDARRPDGELVYGAGNIAMHAIDVEFVDRLTRDGFKLPWHVARKSMPVIDERGEPVKREGVKFESFVFDALAFCERSVTLEVDRKAEFSPVKNAEGEDSPASARADLCAMFASWLERARMPLPPADEHGVRPIEVDPLAAEDAESFAARARAPSVSPRGHRYS